jgi:hypothetical protein
VSALSLTRSVPLFKHFCPLCPLRLLHRGHHIAGLAFYAPGTPAGIGGDPATRCLYEVVTLETPPVLWGDTSCALGRHLLCFGETPPVLWGDEIFCNNNLINYLMTSDF